MITQSVMTTVREAMWKAITSNDQLKQAFALQVRTDQQINGFLMQGLSTSDFPAAIIMQQPYSTTLINYGQEELSIPFGIQLFYPPDRWREAELRIEQVVWAVRNQGPANVSHPVPYIQAACGKVASVQGVAVEPATLQQSASLASGLNESTPVRCIRASAVLVIAPISEAFS